MNVDLLRAEALAVDPAHFDMRDWYHDTPCGTVGCFAYHVAVRHGWQPCAGTNVLNKESGDREYVPNVAQSILGLSEDERFTLFDMSGWCSDAYLKYRQCSMENNRPGMKSHWWWNTTM